MLSVSVHFAAVVTRAAAAMALAGMMAAHAGARTTAGMSPPSLKLALGVLMIAVAPMLPLRDEFFKRREGEGSSDASPNVSLGRSSEFSSGGSLETFSDGSLEGSLKSALEKSPPRKASSASPATARSAAEDTPEARGRILAVGRPSMAGPQGHTSPSDEEGDGLAVGDAKEGPSSSGLKKVLKMFAIGLGSGFLAGVFGVGGGVVTVPAISLATDLSHKEASLGLFKF